MDDLLLNMSDNYDNMVDKDIFILLCMDEILDLVVSLCVNFG